MDNMLPMEIIEKRIFVVRGQRIMLDADLADLYGVPTKRLNEQVKRNLGRFPEDFMFQLTAEEKAELVAICDRFEKLKHSSTFPYAFTEHGAIMLANVLRSERAISVSIQVVRAFVHIRTLLIGNTSLAKRLDALEKKYDMQFKAVFDAIWKLMEVESRPKRRIGFLVDDK
jgi:hypothetical protein